MSSARRGPRLGQNFLSDPSLLDAIVRVAGVGGGDVVLEVGAGQGVLTRRLAAQARLVHAVELDRRLEGDLAEAAAMPGVKLIWGDAMKIDLVALDPAPTTVVSNLPYSVATPVIIRTVLELGTVETWTVMVQREIADRLRADPGTPEYGAPSVLVQLSAQVRIERSVDPAVFKPRPRVRSALLQMRRTGPAAPEATRRLVREAFAHRRKSLARSLELARPGRIEAVREALRSTGLAEDVRAEALSPGEFAALAGRLAE